MPTDLVDGLLWTEKFRPETLDEMALSDENRELFRRFINEEEIPHLLLHGPPGCGKTTVARILANEIDCKLRTFNASSERGIDTVRDKIKRFVRSRMGFDWNIVFLDEADSLTRDAQTALRAVIEDFADQSRFILTANYPRRIIPAIRSRCVEVGMKQIPLKQRGQLLTKILKQEGIEASAEVVMSYAERYTDLRKLLTNAQRTYLSEGELLPAQATTFSGPDIFEAVVEDDYPRLKEMASSAHFDAQAGLQDLFDAVPDDFPRRATFLSIIGRAITSSTRTPNIRAHFLGTTQELVTELPDHR